MTLEPNATRSSNAGPGNAGLSLPTFFIYRSGPGATGDRWRGDTRVQPEGHGGVPKVIMACPAVGEAICRGDQGEGPGRPPNLGVRRCPHKVAVGLKEQPAIAGSPVPIEVHSKMRHQLRRDRDRAYLVPL